MNKPTLPSSATYYSFESILEAIWRANQSGADLWGMNLKRYAQEYDNFGIYYFLRDLEERVEARVIRVGKEKDTRVRVVGRSPRYTPEILNKIIKETIFVKQGLKSEIFFNVIPRLRRGVKEDHIRELPAVLVFPGWEIQREAA